MLIAIDFDGTIVEDRYPEIGRERPFAVRTLRKLEDDGHRLILWTVREGKRLTEAIEWCRERGIEFYAVNKDYPEEDVTRNRIFSRKLKVDLFIDDRNIGGLPDWGTIYHIISSGKSYESILLDGADDDVPQPPKPWWRFW